MDALHQVVPLYKVFNMSLHSVPSVELEPSWDVQLRHSTWTIILDTQSIQTFDEHRYST